MPARSTANGTRKWLSVTIVFPVRMKLMQDLPMVTAALVEHVAI
jgi:hypothetical protein